MNASTSKITKWTRFWIQQKHDERRANPLLWRKVFEVFPVVASPWLEDKQAAKDWMPEDVKAA